MIFAMVVPSRGAAESCIPKRLAHCMDMLGQRKLRLKSDNEPAIDQLCESVRQQRAEGQSLS